ncbi:MAG: hypothetical protein IJS11_04300 [Oscillospiraceae bacterium]|nr:hypothetical protein [Oscillospiraceae bacterium]MBQ9332142.1 hypothetical protein [Oscillospiraceae bacterium]
MSNFEKTALNDEQMDKVTGGTMVPRPTESGDTLQSFCDKINAQNNWHVTPSQLITWNGLPADTDPNAPLPAATVLKVYF